MILYMLSSIFKTSFIILITSTSLTLGYALAGEKHEFTGTAYNTSGFEAPIVTAS